MQISRQEIDSRPARTPRWSVSNENLMAPDARVWIANHDHKLDPAGGERFIELKADDKVVMNIRETQFGLPTKQLVDNVCITAHC